MSDSLTLERFHELLTFDPETGIFRWKGVKARGRRQKPGEIAGHIHDTGHRRITIDGQFYYAHRLAWFVTYGVWPTGDLDHKSNNPDHNPTDNLRPATRTLNNANQKIRSDNTSGCKGVYKPTGRKKWTARAGRKYLGTFDLKEEAAAAYDAEARRLYGPYARTNEDLR
ncbi:HNH endonuclease [Inquilinus limosus]|uniref:AP2/ERF domain-containing protein n=1 Tax=Inquilinus limosus MP06 TaxID=1398085 RepID=A0A0A0DBK2_9PROT|nr:HNH endonuclease [Inquilinus limosus]KGM36101.1 hypothetical protein P409_00170 [Inquilinus limosus MP06]